LKNDNSKNITKEDILGCISKNRISQKSFYNKTYPKLMASSYRLCSKDRQLSEDLLHDAYIKMFKNIHQINLDSFSTQGAYSWCKRVLTNVIYDYYRKQKRMPLNSIEESKFEFTINSEINKSEYCEHKGLNASDVVSAMQALSPQYRLVFEMYLIDGYSHKEISKQLKIGEGTSKSNLHKAKSKVKKELSNMLKVNL
jgi:RNA polymerase sigma-70 factor (ECF subfamily)